MSSKRFNLKKRDPKARNTFFNELTSKNDQTSVNLSELLVLQNDIKSSFKKSEIRNDRMKQKLSLNHNKYFNKIMLQ